MRKRFTKSELFLTAWRSREQAYNLKKRFKKYGTEASEDDNIVVRKNGKRRRQYQDGIGPERMPDEFFADKDEYDGRGKLKVSKGDFDLSRVRGEQARRYFERILRLPMPHNMVTRHIDMDPEAVKMRKDYGMQGESIPVKDRS